MRVLAALVVLVGTAACGGSETVTVTQSETVTRTVTNTTNQASVYVANVKAPPGTTVKVTPTVLTVLPRKSATYTIEISRTNAAFDQYTRAVGLLRLARRAERHQHGPVGKAERLDHGVVAGL